MGFFSRPKYKRYYVSEILRNPNKVLGDSLNCSDEEFSDRIDTALGDVNVSADDALPFITEPTDRDEVLYCVYALYIGCVMQQQIPTDPLIFLHAQKLCEELDSKYGSRMYHRYGELLKNHPGAALTPVATETEESARLMV